jgi:CubicO group peptidase (beta-lactamase class C family)
VRVDLTNPDPKAAGFDEQRLERIADHLERRYVAPGKIAGCQVAVVRGGHLAYHRTLGHRDRERALPVGDDTIWRIYSMTKPITGVALLTLLERAEVALSDPVHRFLPSWRDLRVRERDGSGGSRLVEPHRPMTVRDLLMHTSGLGYEARGPALLGAGEDAPGNRPDATLDTIVDWLAERPLHFHPGTRWQYSVSTDIVGKVIEVVTGRPFDDYVRDEVLRPLGMIDTDFWVPGDEVERFAASYRRNSRKELVRVDEPEGSDYLRPPTLPAGGSGLVSTARDYLRFCRMLVNGGELDGTRVLGPRTVDLMGRNHLPGGGDLAQFATGGFGETGFEGMGFGLTVAVGLGPERTQGLGPAGLLTWGGFASTIFWVDPAEELAVVFLTQLIPSGTFAFRDQLRSLVYAAIVD